MPLTKKNLISTLEFHQVLILMMVVAGSDNDNISNELGISINTVSYHLKPIYKKLKIPDNLIGKKKRKKLKEEYQKDVLDMLENDELSYKKLKSWIAFEPNVFEDEEEIEEIWTDIADEYRKNYEPPPPPEPPPFPDEY